MPDPSELRYCDGCGCYFLDGCPKHETHPVEIKPGDRGMIIKRPNFKTPEKKYDG